MATAQQRIDPGMPDQLVVTLSGIRDGLHAGHHLRYLGSADPRTINLNPVVQRTPRRQGSGYASVRVTYDILEKRPILVGLTGSRPLIVIPSLSPSSRSIAAIRSSCGLVVSRIHCQNPGAPAAGRYIRRRPFSRMLPR